MILIGLLPACDQSTPTPGQTLAATNTVPAGATTAPSLQKTAPVPPKTSPQAATSPLAGTPKVATSIATAAASAVLTATIALSKTNNPANTPGAGLTKPDIQASLYIDDRSTAESLVSSYFNAVNRKEYLRAYSYWDAKAAATQLASFDQFAKGYADTAAVTMTIGVVGGSAGAGQFYNTVPVVLQARTTNGETQNFVGCYVTYLGSPSAQGTPPFKPLAITFARIDPVTGGADPVALMLNVCKGQGIPDTATAPPAPVYPPGDISSNRYLDDRSSPVNVLQSYYNGINRREYVRAYAYWEPEAAVTQLQPYPQFAQGFKDTISVTLVTGQVGSDVGAGQIRYRVPAIVRAVTTGNVPQTFAGCVQLHMAQPAIQAASPFKPLGIESASLKQVPNTADPATTLANLCQSQGGTSSPTPVPTAVPAPGAVDIGPQKYIDDRSTPQSLMMSLFNAVNRREYLRAYAYWDAKGATPPLSVYPEFEKGYAQTAAVQLILGAIGGSAGAGQLYYSVPLALKVQTSLGAMQTFVGCYVLHLSQPGIQGVPPFDPLAIRSAVVKDVANNTDITAQLATVCQAAGIPDTAPVPPQATPPPTDISNNRYLDDRSGPLEVLRSFFNAVNRHEYVRAYSYWQAGSAIAQLPPYPQFEQGYKDTKVVTLTTGQVGSDAGAGQLRYLVPVTLKATTTDDATQTFVGCYRLHLAQPAIQGTPPFQPLAIEAANIQQVANNANTGALMANACQSLP